MAGMKGRKVNAFTNLSITLQQLGSCVDSNFNIVKPIL